MAEIGQTLREARLRSRIDMTEVEAATKIRAKYLRAIENEEFNLLPGPVYAKSFLRTYADYLGLDSRALLDEYRRRYERLSDHELRPLTPRRGEADRRGGGRRRPLLPPWLAIALVLAAIAAGLWYLGARHGGKPAAVTGRRGASSHPPAQGHRARRPPVIGTTQRRAGVPAQVTLALSATGPVYICLVDGVGRRLIPGVIFQPGQAIPVERAPKLLLTLGNANVTMRVDGKPVAVSPSPTSIGFELAPGAIKPLPPPRQPRCT